MEVASATGGEALEDFGKVAGMTGQQFKALWDSDPAAAFQSFIVGLSKLDDEGESAIAVLDEIGIKVTAEQSTQERRNETKWSKPCKAVRSLGLNWRKRVILGTSSARAEP